MNTNITPLEVSFAINKYLNDEGISLRAFCDRFNSMNNIKIINGEVKPLNKDFLLRVKNNEFKVVNKRVLNLCDFIGVNFYKNIRPITSMAHEFQNLEKIVLENPSLEKKLKSFLAEISDLLTTNIKG